jgi:hypothetical protein
MLNLLQTFAQDTLSDPVTYDTSYSTTATADEGTLAAMTGIILIGSLVAYIISSITLWPVFKKAGEDGWKAFVPIYNLVVWLKIVGRPTWWIAFVLLGFIPFVGAIATLVVSIIISHDLSKSFGRGVGMTVLLVLLTPVGLGILGWGSAEYKGPSALPMGQNGEDEPPVPRPQSPQA